MRLGFALSPTPPTLEGQRWTGVRKAKPSDATGETVHLVLRDLPADAAQDHAFTWFGDQILPGDLPSPDEARGMLLNMMDIPAEYETEFNEWYNEEHMVRLGAVDGAIRLRRFRAIVGAPRYLALYHLRDPAVVSQPAWAQAADSPWTRRMQRYRVNQTRIVFTRA